MGPWHVLPITPLGLSVQGCFVPVQAYFGDLQCSGCTQFAWAMLFVLHVYKENQERYITWNSSLSHLIWAFWIFSMFLSGKKVLEALDALSSGGWAESWVKAINLLQAQRGWNAKIASKNFWNLRGNEYLEAAAGWLHVLAWNVLGIVLKLFHCFAGEWSCIPKEKLAQVLLCHSCLWGKSGVPSGKISFSVSLPFFGTFCECSFC